MNIPYGKSFNAEQLDSYRNFAGNVTLVSLSNNLNSETSHLKVDLSLKYLFLHFKVYLNLPDMFPLCRLYLIHIQVNIISGFCKVYGVVELDAECNYGSVVSYSTSSQILSGFIRNQFSE